MFKQDKNHMEFIAFAKRKSDPNRINRQISISAHSKIVQPMNKRSPDT